MRDIAAGVQMGFKRAHGEIYLVWRDGPDFAQTHAVRLPPADLAAVRSFLATPSAAITENLSQSIHGGRAEILLSKRGGTVQIAWSGAGRDGRTKHDTNETERTLLAMDEG